MPWRDACLLELPVVNNIRMPPQANEAEQGLLGKLMISQCWDQISDVVCAEDFYRHDHGLIFTAIAELVDRNQPHDAVTVAEQLESNGDLSDALSMQYLIAMCQAVPSAADNAIAYAEIIRDKSLLRNAITAANEMADRAYSQDGEQVADVIDFIESKAMSLGDSTANSKAAPVSVAADIQTTIAMMEERRDQGNPLTGLPTGMKDIDRKIGGLNESDLIIIAGRPSMGKTAFAMNMAEAVSITNARTVPTLIFSMEMPRERLQRRMLSSVGGVPLPGIQKGDLSNDEWARVANAGSRIERGQLYIDETPALTPSEVRSKSRRLHRECGGLGLIVIDYMQLMETKSRAENRTTQLSEISRSLKSLAKELKVPVIALSQLNRSLESRTDRRPIMSDLRESGAIEQDADVILMMYRDEVYDENSTWKGTAECLVRKQRDGPTGMVRLAFHGEQVSFRDYFDETKYRDYREAE